MKPDVLHARNRRSATRLVMAVLLFHGLALSAGVLLMRNALHQAPLVPVPRATVAQRPVAPAAPANAAALRGKDLPGWVLQARGQDTAAPWRVDAQGRVLLAHE